MYIIRQIAELKGVLEMPEIELVDMNTFLRKFIAKINDFFYDFIVKLSAVFPGLKR